ncbi:TPA: hypothetical protein ACGBG5_003156 [Enterococcus faecalis]
MNKYFTAYEVLEKVEGVHSLSTLNKWISFIQKECNYQFHYGVVPRDNQGNSHSKKNLKQRKVRLFTQDEIEKIQQVANLIPKIGRDIAIRQIFDKYYTINMMKNSELFVEIMREVRLKWEKEWTVVYSKRYQLLEINYKILEKRIDHLEELLASQKQPSSGWFRRKR